MLQRHKRSCDSNFIVVDVGLGNLDSFCQRFFSQTQPWQDWSKLTSDIRHVDVNKRHHIISLKADINQRTDENVQAENKLVRSYQVINISIFIIITYVPVRTHIRPCVLTRLVSSHPFSHEDRTSTRCSSFNQNFLSRVNHRSQH